MRLLLSIRRRTRKCIIQKFLLPVNVMGKPSIFVEFSFIRELNNHIRYLILDDAVATSRALYVNMAGRVDWCDVQLGSKDTIAQ